MSTEKPKYIFKIFCISKNCYTTRRFEGDVPFGELFIGLDGKLYSYENLGMELVPNQDDYYIQKFVDEADHYTNWKAVD